MKIKPIISLFLILGLFVLIGVAHAQTPEKFWAISVGNIHILDGISPFGAYQWRGEIVGTDIINGVDTYAQVGSWRDNFNPAWQPDNRSWISISLPEVRVLANAEFDNIDQLWYSIILDPPGILWNKKPIIVGDSWPISASGVLNTGTTPLSNDQGSLPITVTGTGSVLAAETVAAPMGTYRAYKVQHQIEIRDQANNLIETNIELEWMAPYLGNVKWADAQSTELLSSLTLPFIFSDIPLNNWAYHYTAGIYDDGITQGTATGVYSPLMNVTRDQMAAFIVRAVENGQFYEGACAGPPSFPDVDQNSIFCRNIERLVARRITKGCGDGTTYCPGNNVLRDQMAAFLARAFLGMQ